MTGGMKKLDKTINAVLEHLINPEEDGAKGYFLLVCGPRRGNAVAVRYLTNLTRENAYALLIEAARRARNGDMRGDDDEPIQ